MCVFFLGGEGGRFVRFCLSVLFVFPLLDLSVCVFFSFVNVVVVRLG